MFNHNNNIPTELQVLLSNNGLLNPVTTNIPIIKPLVDWLSENMISPYPTSDELIALKDQSSATDVTHVKQWFIAARSVVLQNIIQGPTGPNAGGGAGGMY